MRIALALAVIAVAVGAFVGGRASVASPRASGAYSAGYSAGREAAFDGFDGGWAYDRPYIVVLRRSSPLVTYTIAQRWPMLPGVEYRSCGRTVCSRRP